MSARGPHWIGCGIALAAALAGLVSVWLGVRGVSTSTTTYRLIVLGELPPGQPFLRERWHEEVPWRGGLLPYLHEDHEHHATLHGHTVEGVVPTSYWGLFGHTLDSIELGFDEMGRIHRIELGPVDPGVSPEPCARTEGSDVARYHYRVDVTEPECLVHPRDARVVEVTLDARRATTITLHEGAAWMEAPEESRVPVGEDLTLRIARRRVTGWGSHEDAYDVDTIEGFVVSEAAWAHLRGTSLSPITLTRIEWRELHDAARGADDGWAGEIGEDHVHVTAPAEPGSRACVVVLGFHEEDEIAIAHPRIVASARAL